MNDKRGLKRSWCLCGNSGLVKYIHVAGSTVQRLLLWLPQPGEILFNLGLTRLCHCDIKDIQYNSQYEEYATVYCCVLVVTHIWSCRHLLLCVALSSFLLFVHSSPEFVPEFHWWWRLLYCALRLSLPHWLTFVALALSFDTFWYGFLCGNSLRQGLVVVCPTFIWPHCHMVSGQPNLKKKILK